MSHITVEALVVGGADYGESNRIVRLMTATHGRLSVVAYRVRSASSKKGGVFDLGNTLRLELKQGRGDLMTVGDVDFITGPEHARKEMSRLLLLSYGCEVVSALAPEGEAAPRLYGLLRVLTEVLEHTLSPNEATRVALEAKGLTFSGLMPSLFTCCFCQEEISDRMVFSCSAGGVLHHTCGVGVDVSLQQIEFIERVRRAPIVETLVMPESISATHLLADFIEYQVGRQIKSRQMLDLDPFG